MADTTATTNKLVGQNYTTPDLVAKVTGKAKYAEDCRAEGCCSTKLLLSPMPHARVTQHRHQRGAGDAGREGDPHRRRSARRRRPARRSAKTSCASAQGERGADDGADVRGRADSRRRRRRRTDRRRSDREDRHRVRAAAVRRRSVDSLRPGGPNARCRATPGCVRPLRRRHRCRTRGAHRSGAGSRCCSACAAAPARRAVAPRCRRGTGAGATRGAAPAAAAAGQRRCGSCQPRTWRRTRWPGAPQPPQPQISELKWTEEDFAAAKDGQMPMGKPTDEWTFGDLEAGFKNAALVLDETFVTPEHQPSAARTAHGDGLLAERQAVPPRSTQSTVQTVAVVARWVGIDAEADVVLISEYTGGGFGSKIPGLHRDGDSGAALEEGERAGDDAHQPRGRALHRPRASGVALARQGRLRQGRHASPRSTCFVRRRQRSVRCSRATAGRPATRSRSAISRRRCGGAAIDGADQHAAARRRSARRAACRATAHGADARQGGAQARHRSRSQIRKINAPAGKAKFGPPSRARPAAVRRPARS